eukprot:COSAG05_NODE_520_length_9047_cov_2.500224_10_plen_104_part_00
MDTIWMRALNYRVTSLSALARALSRSSGPSAVAPAAVANTVRVRVQLIRHSKTCMTEIQLHNECAHVGLSIHAPVEANHRCTPPASGSILTGERLSVMLVPLT